MNYLKASFIGVLPFFLPTEPSNTEDKKATIHLINQCVVDSKVTIEFPTTTFITTIPASKEQKIEVPVGTKVYSGNKETLLNQVTTTDEAYITVCK